MLKTALRILTDTLVKEGEARVLTIEGPSEKKKTSGCVLSARLTEHIEIKVERSQNPPKDRTKRENLKEIGSHPRPK